jgi:hypothetical protein
MGCNVRGIKKAPQQLSVRITERGRVRPSYAIGTVRSNSLRAPSVQQVSLGRES